MRRTVILIISLISLLFCHVMVAKSAITPPSNFSFVQAQTTTLISQHGITWTFAAPVQFGQFVNGDYWVIGPVTIIDINPPSTDIGGRIINGSEINPDPNAGSLQGYDSKMRPQFSAYDPGLNVAYGVSASTPLAVPINSSLISTVSHPITGNRPQLQSASVLTVLNSTPAVGSFRPAFVGSTKTILHNESDINYAVLGSVTPTALAPTLISVANSFARVWLDYREGNNGRLMHPIDNMPGYGRDMSTLSGVAALMLNSNFSNAEKRDLLVNYLQWGIDLQGVIQTGFAGWRQQGGHGGGRKFPVLFAGTVLGDSEMAGVGFLPYNNPVFGEDETTFYLTEYEATRWIGADGLYPANNKHRNYPDAYYVEADWTYVNPNGKIGIPAYGKKLGSVWQGRWISKRLDASYRECCHMNGFTGWILAVHIMGLQQAWNHDALFDYADRYLKWTKEVGAPEWQRHMDRFAGEMWDKYRANY